MATTESSDRILELPADRLQALAARLKARQGRPRIAPRAHDGRPIPLSYSQERLWFLDQLEPGTAFYNIPGASRLLGKVSLPALAAALDELVRRHESLRTTFGDDAGRPFQIVSAPAPVFLPLVDLAALPVERREEELPRLVELETRRAFDLARGPLLRVELLSAGAEDHAVVYTMHHILSDGWSSIVFMSEVAALYGAFSAGRPSPLPPLAIQYPDYAIWQRSYLSGAVLEQHLSYWRERLRGSSGLELPGDRPRPAVETFRGTARLVSPGEATTRALHELSRREGTSLFMTLLAAFKTLLCRYTGQTDIPIGSPIANRTRREVEGVIGFFSNTIVLRSDLAGDPTFRELLGRVREVTLGAYSHEDLPFERIVEEVQPDRDMSRNPLFQIMCVLQNQPRSAIPAGDLVMAPLAASLGSAKFDLTIFWREEGGDLHGMVEHNTDLFDETTIRRFYAQLEAVLREVGRDPGRRLSELPLVAASERHQLLYEWNATAAAAAPRAVHEWVEAQVARTPADLAVVFGEESLTYEELNRRANRMAHGLRRRGVASERLVGICVERSLDMAVAALAVPKAGGALVALDPAYPRDRLATIIDDAGLAVLLTEPHLLRHFPDHAAIAFLLEPGVDLFADESSEDPRAGVLPDHPMYAIYTSGSTGQPKGIVVPHRAFANLLAWQLEQSPLAGRTRTVQFSTFGFCVSFQEIFSSWCSGGTLVMASEIDRKDVEGLGRFLESNSVERLHLPFAALKHLADASLGGGGGGEPAGSSRLPAGLREIITAGEQLQVTPAVRGLFELLPGCSLHNQYGASETHVVSAQSLFGDPGGWPAIPPVGRPIDNVRIHLLDGRLEPVPIGVRGELYAAGECVARGYLNDPVLSAEKMVPDPYGSAAGARLYRTGDLARHLADGRIEYLGRIDGQVKVRGFRVELGEIETTLARYPGVRDAAVVAVAGGVGSVGGGKRLIAYVVPESEGALRLEDLRVSLKRSLPDYMVPAAFITLPDLPLNANGKLDLAALPPPQAGSGSGGRAAYVEPRTPVEEILAGLWSELLGIDRVGAVDNFFELGGHSLLVTQLVSRTRAAFGVELPIRRLFESPTLEALAREIELAAARAEGAAAPPARRQGSAPPPLSFGQERLWFLDRLEPGRAVYNMPLALSLRGRLDRAAMAASLDAIVARHEVLRTVFADTDDGPVQMISAPRPAPPPLVDLSALPAARREAAGVALAEKEAARPFDLARGPLLRATLLALRPDWHMALLTLHHIVSDGWSMGVLFGEIVRLYAAFRAGRPSPLPELPLQYGDFAVWQRARLAGDALAAELRFWKEALAGAPTVLELPVDRPRPALMSTRGASCPFALAAKDSAAVRELAKQSGATLFMVAFAAFSALLHRITGQGTLLVGSTIANRTRTDLEGLIGFFVNTLVLRSDLADGESFRDLVARARERSLAAYAHQDVPFEKLVEILAPLRDPSRPPLVQVVFQLHNEPRTEQEMPGLTLAPLGQGMVNAKFDLVVNFSEAGGFLGGRCIYNTDLFDRTTVERLVAGFTRLLAAAAAAPEAKVAELPLLSAAETHLLGVEWGGQAERFALGGPGRRSLHEVFSARAAESPASTAVVCGGERLSYGELEAGSNRLANFLLSRGLTPGKLVGLCLERSVELVVAVVGVLKAGCAYVPLDPDYPPERLAWLLADSGTLLLVTRSPLVARLDGLREGGPALVRLDDEGVAIAAASAGPISSPAVPVTPRDLAYVIYTSGSTGKPKGVAVEHGQVMRLFAATGSWLGAGAADVWTLFHSYAFDFSVWELWGALLHGGRLVVVPYAVSRSPVELYGLLGEERVTVLSQTPSAFRQLVWAEEEAGGASGGGGGLPALRWVIFGGAALEPSALAPWVARHGDELPRLGNLYGITETTVHTTFRRVRRADLESAASPVGRPLPDLSVHLLDRGLSPVPIGVAGEIFVGGAGVARGYLGRRELTAERFVPDPFAGEPGARLYRSGDLARWTSAGDLVYLGRIDQQVKVRGFRVELGEIQAALGEHPAVREAVVLARRGAGRLGRPDKPDEPELVAYVTADGEGAPAAELRGFLAARLPEHMLPAAYVVLAELPLTAHGKVDRRALEGFGESGAAVRAASRYVAPRDALERFLADLFAASLQVARVGIHDGFFELGGNSIAGAILVNRLQQALGEIVQVVVIFDAPSVSLLALHLRREHPRAVARLWGSGAVAGMGEGEAGLATPVDEAKLAEFRRWVRRLPPRAAGEARNPRAIFVLAPPRSGTTLLRVMLGGHPRLFAPPELELLSFNTLAERRAAFSLAGGGRNSFWLEGAVRAVMAARDCGVAEAEALLAERERLGWSTQALYRELQSWLGERLLVDKTPSYTLDPATLARAEESFAEPLYLHLVRHPYGMIHSFDEAKLDQLFAPLLHPEEAAGEGAGAGRPASPWSRRELAELVWLAAQRNIREFLAGVPAARQRRVVFEELVARPEEVLADVCGFLGLPYDAAMAEPYRDPAARMTDGLHAASRMLGDVKFHQHRGVERQAAERWRRELAADFLGDVTWRMAVELGYRRDEVGRIPAAGRAAGEPLPLSFAQERLWFLDQLEPESPAYNIPLAVELAGKLAPAALAASLAEVVRRHAALRTTFAVAAGRPVQMIVPPGPLALPLVDLSSLPASAREAEGLRLAGDEARRPFDLARGPLFRVALLRLAAARHAVFLSLHHIVADGWSMGVLTHEVGALYAAAVAGAPSPLPELAIQYADFAAWQRGWLAGDELERQLGYWRERFAGAPAALELPTDRPLPALRRHRGASLPFAFPAPLAAALREISLARSTTLYMTLLAGFAALLSRISGQRDVVVGSVIANRNREDVEALIGFFVNTLAMRIGLAGEPSFRDLLGRVRESALGAFGHQDLPFEMLVEELRLPREASRTPLFQVVFQMQNAPPPRLSLPGLELRPIAMDAETAKFDLMLNVSERGGDLGGVLAYDTDLFDRTTAARLVACYMVLLTAAAADAERPVAELPLLGAGERHQVVAEWNDTASSPGRAEDVISRFAAQACRAPAAPAIEDGDRVVGYGELAGWAGALAARLRALGVGPESRVAMLAERTPSMIAGYLAVLALGAAYVALDPQQPAERLLAMMEDAWRADPPSEHPVLLARSALVAGLGGMVEGLAARGAVLVDPGEVDAPAPFAPLAAPAEAAAYVIYTSGSTGTPKGVVVPRGALANVAALQLAAFGLCATDRTTLAAGTGFNLSVWEIWACLAAGATLVVVDDATRISPAALVAWLAARRITLSFLPTAMGEPALAEPWPAETALRAMLLGGDRLHQLPAGLPFRVVNIYGPTECTVVSTAELVPPESVLPSIGRPIENYRVRLVSASGQPVPVGVVAELSIGGAGLARGYLGDPARTAERFVPDPLAASPGERLYRTGDLARFLPDGRLDFLGRRDGQVKIRGIRIELGEIEAALAAHPGVRQAAVVARRGRGELRLAAYVERLGDGEPTAAPADLRAHLRRRLPEPMVPAHIVVLAALPVTANGKVDRAALARRPVAEPGAGLSAAGVAAARTPPRNPTEELLAAIWSEVLEVEAIGVEDDFFALSGHSLLATQVAFRVREAFGVELPVVRLFEHATLGELAADIDVLREGRDGLPPPPPIVPAPRGAAIPASFLQEWALELQGGPVSAAMNLPFALRLSGALDLAALRRAVGEILRRHEVLRSVFRVAGGELVQEVGAEVATVLPEIDLAGLPAARREALARELAAEDASRPFDVFRGPLFSLRVLRLEAAEHALLFNLHHAIGDGWSIEVFQGELAALYGAFTRGEGSPLPPLPLQFADFAWWQRRSFAGPALAAQLAYWHRLLADRPPVVDIPADRPRPAALGPATVHGVFALHGPALAALRGAVRAAGCTLSMALVAALQALLHRYTGEEDVLVGTIVSGRHRRELAPLIGMFMNSVTVRTDLSGDPAFTELMQRVRAAVLDAYRHQDVPFPALLASLYPGQALHRTLMFRAAFNMQSFSAAAAPERTGAEPAAAADSGGGAAIGFPGLAARTFGEGESTSKYDLLVAGREEAERVVFHLTGAADLFDPPTLSAICRDYEALIVQIAAAPATRLEALLPEIHHQLAAGARERRLRGTAAVMAAAGTRFRIVESTQP